MELTAGNLRKLLTYDAETGLFVWLVDRANLAKAGDTAGTSGPAGYVYIMIGGRRYRAHRLAFEPG